MAAFDELLFFLDCELELASTDDELVLLLDVFEICNSFSGATEDASSLQAMMPDIEMIERQMNAFLKTAFIFFPSHVMFLLIDNINYFEQNSPILTLFISFFCESSHSMGKVCFA